MPICCMLRRCRGKTSNMFDSILLSLCSLPPGTLPVREIPEGFQCIICGSVMRQMKNFRRHYIDKHTEQEGHVCRFCGKSYKTKHSMETHQNSFHKEEVKAVRMQHGLL